MFVESISCKLHVKSASVKLLLNLDYNVVNMGSVFNFFMILIWGNKIVCLVKRNDYTTSITTAFNWTLGHQI